jgi:hypothetical protein
MNNDHDAAFQMGQMFGRGLFLLPLLYFLYRASRATTLSLQLANLALSCGLAGLLLSGLGASLGILGGLGGLAGVILAIVALSARRRDEGTGVVRPILGLVLSALATASSAATFLLPIFMDYQRGAALEEPGASAWTYRSRVHDFQLSLPSSRWREEPSEDGQIHFRHPARAQLLLEAVAAKDEAAFEAGAREHTAYMDGAAQGAKVEHRRGVNPKGCRYARSAVVELVEGRDNPVYVASTLIWCADKQTPTAGALVRVLFEGRPGTRATMELLQKTADFIVDSVEDGN